MHVGVSVTDRLFCESLARFLLSCPGIDDVWAASTADDALRLAQCGADVIVVDLALDSDSGGLEVIEAVANRRLKVPILALVAPGDTWLASRALTLGALGLCDMDVSADGLLAAIRTVHSGRPVLPAGLTEPVVRRMIEERDRHERASSRLALLTPREYQVLKLLATGLRRSDIAQRLAISPHTVRTHLRSATLKLGVHDQLAAAATARTLFDAADYRSASGSEPR